MRSRLGKLQGKLKKNGTLPYLVTDLKNIRYLTGFTGSFARLLVDGKKSFFISDTRYEEYAKSIIRRPVHFVLQKGDPFLQIKGLLADVRHRSLYLEDHSLTLAELQGMKKRLRGIRLLPGGDGVNELRMEKEEDEIALMRRAAGVADRCVEHLIGFIRPGLTEWAVANEVESFYRNNGCRKSSFDTIIASGKGSSMPHYQTSMDKVIEKGDVVLIDMGCELDGYNSDLTRTFFVHSIDTLFEKIYSVVKKAQQAACDAVRPGISTRRLDGIARGIIVKEGYGEQFGHSLGHGIGLDVHELPAVKAEKFRLRRNMIVTIEPGIYLPGKGGVRIEDMVLVTKSGHEILTRSSKEITVI